jgi:hypothetical protein
MLLKNVNNFWNTKISFYLETSGSQTYNLYLNVDLFSMPVLIRHLWQLKMVVFLNRCLICAVLLSSIFSECCRGIISLDSCQLKSM